MAHTARFTRDEVIAAARAIKPPAEPLVTSEPHKVSSPAIRTLCDTCLWPDCGCWDAYEVSR